VYNTYLSSSQNSLISQVSCVRNTEGADKQVMKKSKKCKKMQDIFNKGPRCKVQVLEGVLYIPIIASEHLSYVKTRVNDTT